MKKIIFAIAVFSTAAFAAMFCLCPVFLGKLLLYGGGLVGCFVVFLVLSYCLAALFSKEPEKKNMKR